MNDMILPLGIIAAIALAATGVLVWNGSLRRRVKARTRQLNDELAARERSATALEESEQRIRMIISAALDAVITMDARGITTGWTTQAEKTFGWTRAEAVGCPLAELIIPVQSREAHVRGIAKFLETGEGPLLNTRIEITALHKEGHELPVELAISPIRRGESFEFCAFVRDITERKEAEAELQQHRHRLEELVAERTAGLRRAKEAAEKAEAALGVRVTDLAEALGEVKQLRGLLSICSYCKRIREGEQFTMSVEHSTVYTRSVAPITLVYVSFSTPPLRSVTGSPSCEFTFGSR